MQPARGDVMNNQLVTGCVDSVTGRQSTPTAPTQLTLFAILVVLVSLSVHGFWRGILPLPERWLQGVQLGVLVALFAATLLGDGVRALRGFVLLNVVLHSSTWLLFTVVAPSPIWTDWWQDSAMFGRGQVGEIVLKTIQMLVMVAALRAMGLRRADCYLERGQMDAPVVPVRWLGIRRGTNWLRLGVLFSLSSTLFFLVTLTLGVQPVLSSAAVERWLSLLPLVLFLAALNAGYEEVVFKAAPLALLAPAIGPQLATWLTAASFGLGHYMESYFLPGMSVLLPGFLGYMLSKSILETRGIAWAWIIHGCLDVVIFGVMALVSVTATGF